jgi:hypothetical protein
MLRQSFASLAPRVLPRVLEATSRPAIFLAVRNLTSKNKAPGSDPLDVLKKECLARSLCDQQGCRLPGVHWVFSIAAAPDPTKVSTMNIDLLDVVVRFIHKSHISHHTAAPLLMPSRPVLTCQLLFSHQTLAPLVSNAFHPQELILS